LPITLTHHGMAVVNNYLYVMGGSYALVPTSTVFYAPINPDGSVGTWNRTQSLPDIRSDFGTVVVSGTIYVIGGGGAGDVPTNSVYYAKPSGGGTISSWYTATAPLPTTLARHSAVADNGMIYIVGGYDGSTYYPDVYYAIPTSGGDVTSWTKASTTLQQNLILASGVAFGGQLYVAGGAAQNGTVLTKTITSNLLNLDSTPSSWVYSFVLSDPRQRTAAAVSDDGWIYVIEGSKDPVTPLNTIDYGPTSASGSTYVNNGTYTSPIINLSGSYTVTSINWNAFVSQTVSMTLQYKTGNSPDLTAVAWSSPFYATVNNASPVTNTVDTSSQPKAQFVQYLVNLSTLNTASSPVLNAVQVVYDKPALPDFVVTNIQAPPKPTSAMTQTITVSVLNQGEVPYRLTRSNPLKVITQSVAGMPPLPRKSSASLTLTGTYTQTTNYYFYVDVYVDPTITPTLVTDVPATPCASTTFPSEKPFIYSLTMPIGVIVQVQANCWVVPHPDGSPNVFYAQADTCEDLSGNDCSTTYGRILEKNETNNILGPVYSGTGGGSKLLFLPFIER
ncbi:MAG: hypothetical protein KGJ80_13720, partial [Chloroflexota bacterium]|nr:hypothetical protein [Chloroflexota bacterium]